MKINDKFNPQIDKEEKGKKIDPQTKQVDIRKKADSSSDMDIQVNSNLLKEWEQFDQQIKG